MKKIINIMLLASITMLSAGTTAKYFKKETGSQVGGMIDNEVIFIYHKEIKRKNDDSLTLLTNIAKKQICKDKSTRDIIVKAGMSVKFIYIEKDGGVLIVKVDDCKGIEFKK